MSLATLQEMLDRVAADWLFQLAVEGSVSSPPSAEHIAARNARCQLALDDASAELVALIDQLPGDKRPSAETKRVHCIKVALHLLADNRPGAEFASIRKGYDDTIAFYTRIIDGLNAAGGNATPLDGTAEIPEPVFTDDTLEGFV